MAQQGDVYLYQTDDGGDIVVQNGVAQMSGGLETSAYLSLFGGNEKDNGLDDNKYNWWGNLSETVQCRKYRSETQNLINSLPAISSNLRRIEDAAKRDLNWFLTEGVATEINVEASIPSVNNVKLVINILAEGEEYSFKFIENWKAEMG